MMDTIDKVCIALLFIATWSMILGGTSACSVTDTAEIRREDNKYEHRNCVSPYWWDDRSQRCRDSRTTPIWD